MTYKIIKKLIDSGDMKSLEKAGVISLNVRMKFDMFEKYESIKQIEKSVRYDWDAIEFVAIEFKCDSRSVYRAIKIME